MTKIVQFTRRRRSPGWHRSFPRRRPRRGPGHDPSRILIWLAGVAVLLSGSFAAFQLWGPRTQVPGNTFDFVCSHVSVTDGDTFRCGERRVRMEGIDAPELPGHCQPGRDCVSGDPFASRSNLQRLVAGRTVQCQEVDTDRYGRTIGRCFADEVDLSCEQIAGGFAQRRYGMIWCQ